MARVSEYFKTARITRLANKVYRGRLLFPEVRSKKLGKLMRKNSKAIGAAVGGAIALGIGSLFPDMVGSEELNGLEIGIGTIVGAIITTWLFPANRDE